MQVVVTFLVDVSRYLIRLTRGQIFQLGLILGLHATPNLDGIQQSQTFLDYMLTEWLQWKDDVLTRGRHTLSMHLGTHR